MPRSHQLLHPHREPVTPLAAATVLLLRDSSRGLEVLMTRRSLKASFAPGAYVFPGGGIDPADAQAHALARRRPSQSDEALTQALAAIRESFEELGILLARDATGHPVSAEALAGLDRHAPLWPQCQAQGLQPAADAVHVLARWITDRDLPRRFDVPFLVARMPEDQRPVADEHEQFDPIWIHPAEALARHRAGDFFIIFPTVRTLMRLQAYPDVDALLQACAASEAPLWTSCPRAGLLGGKEARYAEEDPPFGELALVCPDGQLLHPLDWQSQQPVPLLRNVQRLTAANPSVMTGPGTNSYLIGDPLTGYIVVDPGPDDPAHQERLWRAAGCDIRAIVCTHSHADHAPGARPLQALCLAAGLHPAPPVLGLPSGPGARTNSHFVPDRALQHQELLVLRPPEGSDAPRHTLQVLHTPGHAANHLCLVLLEDGLLLSGDHILNGSTTVVDPPDGNMSDYLASLDLLEQTCIAHDIAFILPAHGYVLGHAREVIAHLRQHRLQREAKVLRAMQARPDGTLDDWVALAYDDVPERIWPVAKRSLLAHVERLNALPPGND